MMAVLVCLMLDDGCRCRWMCMVVSVFEDVLDGYWTGR